MVSATIYYSVYLLIVTSLTIILSLKYALYSKSRFNESSSGYLIPSIIVATFFCLFIGLRPLHSVFIDMNNYAATYDIISVETFEFNPDHTNVIFDNFISYMAMNGYPIQSFFVIVAFGYFGGIWFACKRLFPKDLLYAFVIYLAAFSTFTYATNGIKAGLAASVFLCAFGFKKNFVISFLFILFSIGIHHSMVLPAYAFICAFLFRKSKYYLLFWLFALIIAVLHISYFQELFAGFADEGGASYLDVEGGDDVRLYLTGFRPDFIIYSAAPIAIGYYAIFKRGYQSKVYSLIYNTYVLTNAIWMLCMYASFTNRIAYLSWLMLPFVLVYPFFDKEFMDNQYNALNKVAWGQLIFTIFMTYIYYGLLK